MSTENLDERWFESRGSYGSHWYHKSGMATVFSDGDGQWFYHVERAVNTTPCGTFKTAEEAMSFCERVEDIQ